MVLSNILVNEFTTSGLIGVLNMAGRGKDTPVSSSLSPQTVMRGLAILATAYLQNNETLQDAVFTTEYDAFEYPNKTCFVNSNLDISILEHIMNQNWEVSTYHIENGWLYETIKLWVWNIRKFEEHAVLSAWLENSSILGLRGWWF